MIMSSNYHIAVFSYHNVVFNIIRNVIFVCYVFTYNVI